MIDSKIKYYFFSGKGGVGKTSLSSATAVYMANGGRKTLIITTDPASNLSDVYEQPIGHCATPIIGQQNLWAMELDPDQATAEYKERVLAPVRGILAEPALKVMGEQLDSPCTTEMAAFEKFIGYLDDNSFDVIIFDTAPTGHTLRLLELPTDWSRVIADGVESGANTCIGPAQALADSKAKFDRAMGILKNSKLTTFTFVLRPEAASIEETRRSIEELRPLGIAKTQLIVNGILPEEVCTNPFFKGKYYNQMDKLKEILELDVNARAMLLQKDEIRGVALLKKVGSDLFDQQAALGKLLKQPHRNERVNFEAVKSEHEKQEVKLVSSSNDGARLIFFAGKGGVGKTVMSCIAAVNLAGKGQKTLLVTTDPAAHIAHVLDRPVGQHPDKVQGVANLWAVCIDPKAEAKKYKERVLADADVRYSADRLAAMEEELDSPCTEEMAVFYRFIEYASSTDYSNIVFDTAPTGHTLRLLKLPVDWSKQLEIKTYAAAELSDADTEAKSMFDEVISRLQDPERTSFVFVVYPEHTPIVEAYRAVLQLESIGISPALVIANQVLPLEFCEQEFFAERLNMQRHHMDKIAELFNVPVVSFPLLLEEPRGIGALRDSPISFT